MVKNIETISNSTIINLKETPEARKNVYYKLGSQILTTNHIALITLAGGQGTRLGSSLPKGMYIYNDKDNKTIFELFAERIWSLINYFNLKITWYIMTSSATNKETVDYFVKQDSFKLDVKFCIQEDNINLHFNGQPIVESLTSLGQPVYSMSPDGSGGVYRAIYQSRCYNDMINKSTQYVQIVNIDNINVRLLDPMAFGIMEFHGFDLLSKANYDEIDGCGLFCLENGKPSIVEYFEASEKDRATLLYGNVGVYFYSFSFFQKCLENCHILPIHQAAKKIPYFCRKEGEGNTEGFTVTPDKNNGYKQETFIFDLFHLCSKSKFAIQAVDQNVEFAPIKNATGHHSPETALHQYSTYFDPYYYLRPF